MCAFWPAEEGFLDCVARSAGSTDTTTDRPSEIDSEQNTRVKREHRRKKISGEMQGSLYFSARHRAVFWQCRCKPGLAEELAHGP